MKHSHLRTILTAAALAFFTAWGSVQCLITAFDLRLQEPSFLILICGLTAAGSALLFSIRHGGTVLLCLLALFAGYCYHDGRALHQLQTLITQLSAVYDRAYGWGILTFSSELPGTEFVDWPLCIWGSLIAMAVCRSICRQRSGWLPCLVTVLPLCSCIVVTDTVPEEVYLLMVMACLILLVLTSSVRRENGPQGDRLTAAALLPVLLALGGLFLGAPREGYVNRSEILRENILTAVQNLPEMMDSGMDQLASNFIGQPPKQVDLASLGARIPFTYPVMEVTAEKSGTLYLREQDYDQYDGFGWTASEGRTESFSGGSGPEETIEVRTKSRKQIQYLPYHPASPVMLSGGFAENPDGQEYQIRRRLLDEDWRQIAYGNASVTPEELTPYLVLPENTRQQAASILEDLYHVEISNTAKADIIAALVTDTARYDLNSPKMPAGEPDFALWFLREGERGYCVHFATAATVLLRAAGIPARYVTGYLVEAEAGKTVTVTEEDAHAWAEYFEPNLGVWLPLEATPADLAPVQTNPRPAVTEATEESDPTETTVPKTEPASEPADSVETLPKETNLPTPEVPESPASQIPWTLLLIPILVLLLPLQRSLRLRFRRKYQRRGSPNQQALRRWQESVRLARLLKESPTEELIVLAQKAKFSQYELTTEELLQFDSFQRTCLRRLKEKPWYLQVIYRYLYAAY